MNLLKLNWQLRAIQRIIVLPKQAKDQMSNQLYHYSVVAGTLILLVLASLGVYGKLAPENEIDFAVYTLALLLCLSIQIVERYFTRPGDVVVNAAGLLLVLLPLRDSGLSGSLGYRFALIWAFATLIFAIVASVLYSPEKPLSFISKISHIFKEIAVKFGSGRLLYSFAIFILIVNSGSPINNFFIAAISLLLLNIVMDRNPLPDLGILRRDSSITIGSITGTVGDDVFRGKFPKGTRPPKGVIFKQNSRYLAGAVVNSHPSLDGLELEFVCLSEELPEDLPKLKNGQLCAFDELSAAEPVGYVGSGTSVSELKFLPIAQANVDVGNIVEVKERDQSIYYQVQDAEIRFESIDPSNKGDQIIATAAQLGTYNTDKQIFQRFDWLPRATALVQKPTEFPEAKMQVGEYLVGSFPGTEFPVYVNVKEAITHHCAVLGVTGTGKSVFCREFIRQTQSSGIKYICVDITNEYIERFGDDIVRLVPVERSDELSKIIEYLYTQRQKFPNNRDREGIQSKVTKAVEIFKPLIREFVQGDKHIGLVEFVDLSGTIQNFEYLKWFFHSLFELAKEGNFEDATVCIVLEEAHTIVPEWNFVADNDKAISGLLNSISQIALQGRKYGVGLLVIAQRTANVSKTILTQCNTVIAFQQFDKTSADFLESFVGGDAGRVLPNLKPRTAIATGKGLRSSTPVIFEVPTITEPSADDIH